MSKITATPDPLLLAGTDVVVGIMQDAGLSCVIVSANEVVLASSSHVGGGNGDVLVPTNVHAFRIVMLVISARGDRISAHVAFAVIHHRCYIRRHDRLGVGVDRYGRVSPPKESLGKACAIVEISCDGYVRLTWIEGDCSDDLGAVHLVDIMALDSLAAIGEVDKTVIDWTESSGAMVLRPVKFDASRDPRSRKADQCRLYDIVSVDEIVPVGLILGILDSAP